MKGKHHTLALQKSGTLIRSSILSRTAQMCHHEHFLATLRVPRFEVFHVAKVFLRTLRGRPIFAHAQHTRNVVDALTISWREDLFLLDFLREVKLSARLTGPSSLRAWWCNRANDSSFVRSLDCVSTIFSHGFLLSPLFRSHPYCCTRVAFTDHS